MEKKNIYLCGAINGCSDEECKTWREQTRLLLSNQNCIDPMRNDYRGIENQNVCRIIDQDKADIDNSEIVLVMIDKPSFGVAMEIMLSLIHI